MLFDDLHKGSLDEYIVQTVVMFNQALIKCLTYFCCSVHAFYSNTVGLIGIGDVYVEITL